MDAPGNPPPLDRALVLAASVGALSRLRCWLETRCHCGACTQIPVPLLAKEGQGARTIADVLLRLRCRSGGRSPVTVELMECVGKQDALPGGRLPWRVELLPRT